MITLLDIWNALLTSLFAGVFGLFRLAGLAGSLWLFSILAGIGMLWLFGRLSNQARIKKLKNQMQAEIIAIRLFQNDLGVLFKTQLRVLMKTGVYLRYTATPMLILFVPLLFLLIQFNLFYSYTPLAVGRDAVVTLKLADDSLFRQSVPVTLQAPAFASVETEPIWIPTEKAIAWRIRGDMPGTGKLSITIDGQEIGKELVVGDTPGRVSPLRTRQGLDLLLNPGERALPSTLPVKSVQITYPPRDIPLAGWNIHWIIQFFILSLLAGYLCKGWLKVEF
ncbi:MAG: hypothetical protein RBU29_02670 [bacterium]|jgi:hypothetical protein|nr:hypothetical protein [bacterium]